MKRKGSDEPQVLSHTKTRLETTAHVLLHARAYRQMTKVPACILFHSFTCECMLNHVDRLPSLLFGQCKIVLSIAHPPCPGPDGVSPCLRKPCAKGKVCAGFPGWIMGRALGANMKTVWLLRDTIRTLNRSCRNPVFGKGISVLLYRQKLTSTGSETKKLLVHAPGGAVLVRSASRTSL